MIARGSTGSAEETVEPVLSALMGPADPRSLLELAFSEAVAGADQDDEITARLLDAAHEQFRPELLETRQVRDEADVAALSVQSPRGPDRVCVLAPNSRCCHRCPCPIRPQIFGFPRRSDIGLEPCTTDQG